MNTAPDEQTESPAAGSRGIVQRLMSAPVRFFTSLTAGGLLFSGMVIERGLGHSWGQALVWISLAMGLFYGLRAAVRALAERSVDIDVLMVVGAILAAGVGHPSEGALLLFLFVLSGALEDLAMARTRREIEALHKLMPTEALRWDGDEWQVCSPDELEPGDRVKVRPGDVVPVDARIASGHSSVDQSTLTGESMPRRVVEGDPVYAGTVNLSRPVEVTVERRAAESSIQKILNLVAKARQQRESIQRLIDRLSKPYALAVLLCSAAIVLVWWQVLWFSFGDAAYIAITFLIVLSPCAVIIATPTATLAAIARGARAGVLFKGGQAIDRLARIGAVCFDKTGTLTEGTPKLVRIDAIGWSDPQQLLGVAAGLETDSTHPIAHAVHEAARDRGVEALSVVDTTHEPGQGIVGTLDGTPVAIGLYEYVQDIVPVCLRALTLEKLRNVQHAGQLAAVIAAGGDQGAAAVFVIADPLRPGARAMIGRLQELGLDPVRLLTGDSEPAAAYIAEQVGITDWRSALLPEDKVELLQQTRAERRGRAQSGVAFIGDGVNDAPALAAADVAIAIGSIGSDAALESSDIVLLSENLERIPWSIELARRTRGVLRFNIIFALSIIGGMGLATLVGSLVGREVEMWVGVLAHEGGTLLVVLNSLRLLWARSAQPAPVRDTENPVVGAAVPCAC